MPKVVKPRRFPWRMSLTLVAWAGIAGSTAIAAKRIQHFMWTDARFTLAPTPSGITFEGVRYASRERINRMFTPDYGRSAFQVPLAERRRRLLAVDWVEDASISRLWPNHLVVRVKERQPVAFVHVANHYLLIDADGVFLSPPPRVRFDFPVLSGLAEEQSEEERARRVRAMQGLMAELKPVAALISEVNAASLEDLRVTAEVDHHLVELWMGDRNYAARFRSFLSEYAEIRKTSPNAKVFDLRLDDRITTK